jgi:hypothetical protein
MSGCPGSYRSVTRIWVGGWIGGAAWNAAAGHDDDRLRSGPGVRDRIDRFPPDPRTQRECGIHVPGQPRSPFGWRPARGSFRTRGHLPNRSGGGASRSDGVVCSMADSRTLPACSRPDADGTQVLAIPPTGINLLPYGDAEELVGGDGTEAVAIPGWTLSGPLTVTRWNLPDGWPLNTRSRAYRSWGQFLLRRSRW